MRELVKKVFGETEHVFLTAELISVRDSQFPRSNTSLNH